MKAKWIFLMPIGLILYTLWQCWPAICYHILRW